MTNHQKHQKTKRGGIQSKLEKKKEKIQQTIQKFLRGYYEQLYANKKDNLEETDKFLGVKPSKTAPGRNRKYEQTNSKHRSQHCNRKKSLQKKAKAQGQMASQVNSTKSIKKS